MTDSGLEPVKEENIVECRACLQEINSFSIFYNLFDCVEQMGSTIAEKLSEITHVQISEADELPKVICDMCYTLLQSAHSFAVTVRKTDQLLRQKFVRLNQQESEAVWPKPIQISSNIEIKEEVPTEDHFTKSKSPDEHIIDPDIKPEPNTQQQDESDFNSPKINGICSLKDMEVEYLDSPYSCENAEKEEETTIKEEPVSVEESESVETDLSLECMLCTKTFNSVTGLKAHVITQHSYKCVKRKSDTTDSPQKVKHSHVCEICKRAFATSTDLMVHETCHNKCKCYMCNKSFSTFVELSQHRLTCEMKIAAGSAESPKLTNINNASESSTSLEINSEKMDNDYFIEDLRVIEDINEVENLMPLTRSVKHYKIRKNPLEELEEGAFKKKYRFFKHTAVMIIDMVKDDLAGDTRGGFIPPHLKVLAAIRTWARGEIQDDAGDLGGMSQSTISLICKQVALAIVAYRAHWIKMPQSEAEQNEVIAGFYALCGFRQVIGVIDCTHVRIPKAGGDVAQYYINRKGYSSINVQAVSNANLEIMDIVAHWRGSTHDSRIFNECHLKQRFEQLEFKGRLLGDEGYACSPYLFTPVLNPTTQKDEMYNRAHTRTRYIVERCFKVWKQRFRCLLRGFTTKLENIKLFIVALAVLHNIAMHTQDFYEEEEEGGDDEVPVRWVISGSRRGNAARAAFINENF